MTAPVVVLSLPETVDQPTGDADASHQHGLGSRKVLAVAGPVDEQKIVKRIRVPPARLSEIIRIRALQVPLNGKGGLQRTARSDGDPCSQLLDLRGKSRGLQIAEQAILIQPVRLATRLINRPLPGFHKPVPTASDIGIHGVDNTLGEKRQETEGVIGVLYHQSAASAWPGDCDHLRS